MTLVEIIGHQYVTIHKQEEEIKILQNQKIQLEEQVKKLTPVVVVGNTVGDSSVSEAAPA